jgi:hypothetical protein
MNANLFNTNRTVLLAFTDTTWTASTNLNINFPVKEIVVRGISYVDGNLSVATAALNSMALLYSDLVGGNYLGVVDMASVSTGGAVITNTHIQSSVGSTLRYAYRTPQNVSGLYTFSLRGFDGLTYAGAYAGAGTKYQMAIQLEFIQYESALSNVIL